MELDRWRMSARTLPDRERGGPMTLCLREGASRRLGSRCEADRKKLVRRVRPFKLLSSCGGGCCCCWTDTADARLVLSTGSAGRSSSKGARASASASSTGSTEAAVVGAVEGEGEGEG